MTAQQMAISLMNAGFKLLPYRCDSPANTGPERVFSALISSSIKLYVRLMSRHDGQYNYDLDLG